MEGLYTLMARVPTWVWIIIGLCVVLPVARAAIRKGAKVLGIVAIVLALLFMFPSIGSAFMDRVGLTYNAEEKSITNREGTTISINSFKDIIGTGHGADKLIEKAVEKSKDATYRLDDLQKEIKNLSEVQDSATYARDENYSTSDVVVTITDEILENAKNLGLNFSKNTRIIKRGRVYYMVAADGNEIELSDQLVSALGIK